MVQRVSTVACEGIEARAVDVQVQVAPGLPAFNIVGLPDKAVSEAKERVRAALIASGLALPARHHETSHRIGDVMTGKAALNGLIEKRAEIAGQIDTMQREMRNLVGAISHIDAAIRLFDPTVDLDDIKPRLPPRFQAFKGEVSRLVLNALRESTKPIPVSDMTLIVAAGRGLNPDDKPFMRTLSRRVGACLRNLRKKDLVVMTRPPGSLGLWDIKR